MIVPMDHLTILCTASSKEQTLKTLQQLGVLHLTTDGNLKEAAPPRNASELLAQSQFSLSSAEKALLILEAIPRKNGAIPIVPSNIRLPDTPEEILAINAKISDLASKISALKSEINLYQNFREFNPDSILELQNQGIEVTLFKTPIGATIENVKGSVVKIINTDIPGKTHYGVIIGAYNKEDPNIEIIALPRAPLSHLQKELSTLQEEHQSQTTLLSASFSLISKIKDALAERKTLRDFHAAMVAMRENDDVAWITGYCPQELTRIVLHQSRENGWGILSRPPEKDELPPTLLRPPKIFRPITSLFTMLGISPSYYEADVSVVFYSFFTIFFAMLVGDAGYGLLILALAAFLPIKNKNASILLYVFAFSTILWGVITSTYFGIPQSALPAWTQRLKIDSLGENSNVMQLCFFLGAVHLSIARIWNSINRFPCLKALAELGWVGVIWTMYAAACMVVVEGYVFPSSLVVITPVSILLIALFMLNKEELKTDGINLAILPLNIMSALGDIISYVRLFAVGLASVKVAENFNSMAISLDLPLAAKIPIVILILLIGHGLNFAMGALSILVHAVRLNTLEFSNHKGVSWSGFAYEPFRK